MRLDLLIRRYLSGATRIDVHKREGTGWRKVNALHLDEGDDAVEPGTIGAMVKACADHHAAQAEAAGKYRAMIWRYASRELDHKKARFDVELVCPAKRSRPRAHRDRGGLQRTAFETTLMLEEILEMSTAPGIDRVAALRRATESPLDRVQHELSEMAVIYDEGSSTETADGIALAEQRIRSKLAGLLGQEDADVWTAIAPMVEADLDRLRETARSEQTAEGDGDRTDPAGGRAPEHDRHEPDAERTEGAPPSSGDAPPAGKDAGS